MSGVEWDIARNLPTYTNDFIRMFSIGGHLCGCHLQREQCYGCEAMDCKFHENRKDWDA